MVEPTGDSVTAWIASLKDGDAAAAQRVWERYIEDMIRLARTRLRGASRTVADEEDAALSAFDSFFRGARQGRYPRLDDREDLWRLLVVITERKAIDLSHHERRQKRGGGRKIGTLDAPPADDPGRDPRALAAPVASPERSAALADECQRLLGSLPSPALRQVALMKMEGYTHQEIADRLGCSLRSVARKVELIRATWENAVEEEP